MSDQYCTQCGNNVSGSFCTKCGQVAPRAAESTPKDISQPAGRRAPGLIWLATFGIVALLILAGAVAAFVASQGGKESKAAVRSTATVVSETTVVLTRTDETSIADNPPAAVTPSGDCRSFPATGAYGSFTASNIQIGGIDCSGARAMIASGPSGRVNEDWYCPLTGDRSHTACTRNDQSVSWDITQ